MTRPRRTIKPAAGRPSVPLARIRAVVARVTYGLRYVQLRNPRTDRWVKVDRYEGRVTAHKRTDGPYKSLPVADV